MKYLIRIASLIICIFFVSQSAIAQQDKSKRPSPPDRVTASVGSAKVIIDYSQPSTKGRDIFGGLVPYGKVWRTGANESSWIEVSSDVMIQGEKLPKGKYGLFTIPGKDEWVVIFNSASSGWGAYDYSKSKDVLRVSAKTSKTALTEKFTITINNGKVTMAWDETKVEFTIE